MKNLTHISNMKYINYLYLKNVSLYHLPLFNNLKNIILIYCQNLEYINLHIKNSINITIKKCPNLVNINIKNIRNTTNTKKSFHCILICLYLENCKKIEKIPHNKDISELHCISCDNLKNIEKYPILQKLYIENCGNIDNIDNIMYKDTFLKQIFIINTKIQKLHLPNTIKDIMIKNCKILSSLNIDNNIDNFISINNPLL